MLTPYEVLYHILKSKSSERNNFYESQLHSCISRGAEHGSARVAHETTWQDLDFISQKEKLIPTLLRGRIIADSVCRRCRIEARIGYWFDCQKEDIAKW